MSRIEIRIVFTVVISFVLAAGAAGEAADWRLFITERLYQTPTKNPHAVALGRIGGQKSRRKITPAQQKMMQDARKKARARGCK
jgi:hypothetical protein